MGDDGGGRGFHAAAGGVTDLMWARCTILQLVRRTESSRRSPSTWWGLVRPIGRSPTIRGRSFRQTDRPKAASATDPGGWGGPPAGRRGAEFRLPDRHRSGMRRKSHLISGRPVAELDVVVVASPHVPGSSEAETPRPADGGVEPKAGPHASDTRADACCSSGTPTGQPSMRWIDACAAHGTRIELNAPYRFDLDRRLSSGRRRREMRHQL